MKKTCKIINKILKIISNIIFVLLLILMAIMIFYVVRVKFLANEDKLGTIRINFYTILSQSMHPTISAGDVVVTYSNEDPTSYNKGDIITFVSKSNNGVLITHQIQNKQKISGETFYTTKGENNNTQDPSLVNSNDVIGKVILTLPKVGYIQQFLVTKTGWIVAVIVPCLGVIIYDILKLLKIANKKNNKQVIENSKSKEELKKLLSDDEKEVK